MIEILTFFYPNLFKVPELNTISCISMEDPLTGTARPAVKVGAAVTLSAMEEYFIKLINKVVLLFYRLCICKAPNEK